MGSTVCRAIAEADGLELVAAVDAAGTGTVEGLEVARDLRALADAGAEVVVDFTVAEASRVTLPWLALHGMHAVVGTTGFDDADLAGFRSAFTASNAIIAANFAIGAVLMMRFAEMAAPHFDTVEIVEYHHESKVDAPSGTAAATAERIAAADAAWLADPTRTESLPGARGGKGPADIRVHSVRMRGMVAHQDVIFGAQGQTLSVRHDSYDRSSFMPGVVLACRKVSSTPGVTLGIDSLL
jgi:4-hydroxy-tetrahydrodipicolinate reductase